MAKEIFKNFRHRLTKNNKVEVSFTYEPKGKTVKEYIKFEEPTKDPIESAKKVVQKQIEDGTLEKYSIEYLKNRKSIIPLLFCVGFLAASTITFGILYGTKNVPAPLPPDPTPIPLNVSVFDSGIVLSNTTVEAGKAYSTKISLDSTLSMGKILPLTIQKVVSGTQVLLAGSYEYTLNADRTEANFSIPADKVTGNVSITLALSEASKINVSVTGSGLTAEYEPSYYDDENVLITLTPEEGCELPEEVIVNVGGIPLAEGEYVYNKFERTLLIPQPQGDVEVFARAYTPFTEIVYHYDPRNASDPEFPDDRCIRFGYTTATDTTEAEIYLDYENDPTNKMVLPATGEYGDYFEYTYDLDDEVKDYHIRIYGDITWFNPSEFSFPYTYGDCYITYIGLGESVEHLDCGYGYGCYYMPSLEEVSLSRNIKDLGSYTFYACTSLTNLIVPSSIECIYQGAYAGCNNLANVIVEKDSEFYDSRHYCNAVISTVDVYDITDPTYLLYEANTLVIGSNYSFIPDDVVSIYDSAFLDMKGLTEIEIPDSVKTIDRVAFSGTGLSEIVIPSTVETIEADAFSNCENLAEITFIDTEENPSKVAALNGTFSSCTSLKSLTLPRSVTSFLNVIDNCTSLRELYFTGSSIHFSLCDLFAGEDIDNGLNCLKVVDFSTLTSLPTFDNPYYVDYGLFGKADKQQSDLVILVNNEEMKTAFEGCSDGKLNELSSYYQVKA